MRCRLLCVVLVLGTVGVASGALCGSQEDKDAVGAKLIGTWKLVSAKYGDRDVNPDQLGITLKHITPGNFVWVTYDAESKRITRAAGGTFTLNGESYEERPQYGLAQDFEVVKDQVHKFTAKIDGDKWQHRGELANGLKIDEVWERQKAK